MSAKQIIDECPTPQWHNVHLPFLAPVSTTSWGWKSIWLIKKNNAVRVGLDFFCHLLVVNIFVCCFHPRAVECVFELRTVDTISAQLQTKRTNLICKCRSRVHQGGVRYRSSLVCRCVLWMLFYVVSMLSVPYVQSRLQNVCLADFFGGDLILPTYRSVIS